MIVNQALRQWRRALRIALWSLLGFAIVIGLTILIGGRPLILRVFFLLHGTTSPLALLDEAAPSAKHVAYGSDSTQFGELLIPEREGKFPVAVLLHGGCWSKQIGPLPDAVTSLALLRPLSTALARAGIATWNVEYRRLGNSGGGWPGTYEDVANAADYVRELSPDRLDLTRVVVVGHSSGGHLALWLAARSKLPNSSPLYKDSPLPITGVIDIDGPPDLEAFTQVEQDVCGGSVVEQLIGGTPKEFPSRYRESSVTGFLPIGAKQEILYSTKMEFVSRNANWAGLFTSYGDLGAKTGDSVRVLAMENAGHFDGLNPRSAAGETVVGAVKSILLPQ